MKKKIRFTLAFIIILSLVFSACQSNVPENKTEESLPDVSDVKILDKPRTDVSAIKPVFDKGVAFKVDKAHTNTIEYIFGKEDQFIKLEDENGIIWTLELPADALLSDVKISMTALADIKSGDLGAFNGGVIFEPDGLQFSAPAKLTVTGKNVDSKCVLLTGDNEGKTLDFINLVEGKKGVSAEVAHFSTVFATPSSANSILIKQAGERLDEMNAAGKKVLAQPIEVLVPPTIPIKCNHKGGEKNQEIIDNYVKQFKQPEYNILMAIVSAESALAALNQDVSLQNSIARKLSDRLVKKSVKLIKSYRPKPDYFMACEAAVDSVAREDVSLTDSEDSSFLIHLIAGWAMDVTDNFLKELGSNHDYKKIHPIIEMGRIATRLSGGESSDYLQRLSDALQFRIEYECIVNLGSEDPMGFATEGRIRLNLEPNGINTDVTPNIGTGRGKYTGFITPDPQLGLVRPNAYDLRGQVIDFLPCQNEKFDILIDRFGARKEVMTVKGHKQPVDAIVQRICVSAFYDKLATNPLAMIEDGNVLPTVFYQFNLDVHNMNEVAGEKTFKADLEGNKIEFTLKLVHTPNGKGSSKSEDSGNKDPFATNLTVKGDDDTKEPGGGDSSEGGDGTDGSDSSQSDNGSVNSGLITLSGKLPEGFPEELAQIPSDAKIITGSGDASSYWTVVYITEAKPSEAADFVKKYMKSAEEYEVNDLGAGVSITGIKSNLQIAVMIIDSGGTTMVSISIVKS